MAKKKVKKVKKTKKVVKAKKAKKAVRAKRAVKAKKVIKAELKEKILGKIDHFFSKISVAAVKVLAPFKVGDIIHVKGHTTDFVQRVDSIQIEHQQVSKVKKGDDAGIKAKEFVRQHDMVYLSDERALAARPVKSAVAQAPLFQTPAAPPPPKVAPPAPLASKMAPKMAAKTDPYSNTRFLNF
jgi:hypothetical protein